MAKIAESSGKERKVQIPSPLDKKPLTMPLVNQNRSPCVGGQSRKEQEQDAEHQDGYFRESGHDGSFWSCYENHSNG
jgi:hypothetical protein